MLSTFFILIREGKIISELFINDQIRDKEVRVIGENGEQLGIMSSKEALQLAEEAGVDLVKIAPTAKPPVCKIVVTESIVTNWRARKKKPERSRR